VLGSKSNSKNSRSIGRVADKGVSITIAFRGWVDNYSVSNLPVRYIDMFVIRVKFLYLSDE
jgi:hypothetical protein